MNTKQILATSLAAVFVISMIFAGSIMQAEAIPKGKHSPDFRIEDVESGYVSSDSLTMEVEGTAGATIPTEEGDIYAYVFLFSTEDAIAVTSHDFDDTTPDVANQFDWHVHTGVQLDENGCVIAINGDTAGKTVTFDGNSLTVQGAGQSEEPVGGLTAILNVDPDRPKGAVCVIHVLDMFTVPG